VFEGVASSGAWHSAGPSTIATARALERAAPFLRRQIGRRLRLKRVPELTFLYDDSIAGQDRIERLLNELQPGVSRNHDDGNDA
jgi:ribosome-binding factor A